MAGMLLGSASAFITIDVSAALSNLIKLERQFDKMIGLEEPFEKADRASEQMGKSIASAGADIAKGMDKAKKASEDTSQSLDKAEKSAAQFRQELNASGGMAADFGSKVKSSVGSLDEYGAALAVVGGGLAAAGKLALDQERQIFALTKAYGEGAATMLDYADSMQEWSSFSDDAARGAELTFSTLSQNYGVTTDQIQQLMTVSADLATLYGKSLPDVAERLAAALRGEAEAAEAIGLTLNQQSIDREGLTLTMTNQEAAQFRLNAVMQQAAFATGSAAEYAGTAAGKWDKLKNSVQDNVQAFGAVIGPLGSLTAGIGLSVTGAASMTGAMTKLASSQKLATIATSALGLATNPLALAFVGISAAVVGGLALWTKYRSNVDENAEAMKRLGEVTQQTTDIISRLNLSGNFALADKITRSLEDLDKAIIQVNSSVPPDLSWIDTISDADFAPAIDDFLDKDVGQGFRRWADKIKLFGEDTSEILTNMANGDRTLITAYAADIEAAIDQYVASFVIDPGETADIKESLNSVFELYSNPQIDAGKLNDVIGGWIDQLAAGTLSSDEFTAATDALVAGIKSGEDPFNVLRKSADELSIAIDGLTERQRSMAILQDDLRLEGLDEMAEQIGGIDSLIGAVIGRNDEWANSANQAAADVGGAFAGTSATYEAMANVTSLTAEQANVLYEAQDRLNAKIRDGSVDADLVVGAIEKLNAEYEAGTITGDEYIASIVKMSYHTDEFAVTAESAGGKAKSFFDILQEGIDSLGARLQEGLPEQSWFDSLLQSTGLTGKFDVDAWWDALPWNQPHPLPEEVKDSVDEWIAYINEVPQFSEEWNVRTGEYKAWATDQQAIHQSLIDGMRARNAASAQADRDFLNQRKADLEAQEALLARAGQMAGEQTEQWLAEQEKAVASLLDIGGIDTFLEKLNLTSYSTEYSRMAGDIIAANDRMSTSFRVIVQNTDALAQTADGIMQWAEALIGAEGTVGAIDDLLAKELINPEQYEAAQNAYNAIADANLRIQDSVLAIQAVQAPFMAQWIEDQATLLESLAGQDAAQQRITLGWMDTNSAVQANGILAQAAAVANGELGEAGRKGFEAMVEGAIAANPFLEDMLTDLGLITRNDWTGELEFHYDQAKGANDAITQLTKTIYALVDMLDDGKLNASVDIDVYGQDEVDDAMQTLREMDNKTFNAKLNIIRQYLDDGDDGPKTPVGALGNALKNLGGGDEPASATMPDGTPVTSLPSAGSGPRRSIPRDTTAPGVSSAIKVPPIDTSAFDASVAALAVKSQAALTAVNAVFTIAIPANITAGMTTSSAAITTGTGLWTTSFATSGQSVLTAVNAIFAVAIPANVLAGMTAAQSAVDTGMAAITASTATQSQASLTVVSAVFGTAIPANVQSGMASASAAVSAGAGRWLGIISGFSGAMSSAGYSVGAAAGQGVANGMASALGRIQSVASQIAAVVQNTIALQLQIQSPSKVTRKLGEWAGEGFALGLEGQYSRVWGAAERLSGAVDDAMSADKWVDARSGSGRTQRGSGGTDNDSGSDTGTSTETEAKWSDAIAKGLKVATSDALKNSGLGTDTTVGSLFNEADFMARVKAMGEARANDISDLFIGRTWLNSTDALINGGKFLEEYLSPVRPDESITNQPPVTDPTRPGYPGDVSVERGFVTPKGQLPNRPNTGSGRTQSAGTTVIYQNDNRSTVTYTPEPERFAGYLKDARSGAAGARVVQNASRAQTLASGARTAPGRY